MFKPSHLTDEAANVIAGAIEERIYFIQSKRWIAYPKAVQILDHLNKLLKHPRTTRMPSLIVYGDSGMGKSMLVDKFKADCAAGRATDSTPNPNKLLVIELSGRPTERRLFSQILAAVDAPHNPRASIVDVERGAVNTLRDIGVQILVLDEIHNILAGSWREQRIVLNTLRFLSNELNFHSSASESWRQGTPSTATFNWRDALMPSRCHDGPPARNSNSSSLPSFAISRCGSPAC
jgi:hypothetical protein